MDVSTFLLDAALMAATVAVLGLAGGWFARKHSIELQRAIGLAALALLTSCPLLWIVGRAADLQWFVLPTSTPVRVAPRSWSPDAKPVASPEVLDPQRPDGTAQRSGSVARTEHGGRDVGEGQAQWMARHGGLLWIVGVCFSLARLVRDAWRVRQLVRRSGAPTEALRRSVAQAARRVGLARVPAVRSSPEVGQPVCTGVMRPVVLVDGDWSTSVSPRVLTDVLVHECAHLRNHDLLVGWWQRFLQAVHWYNPLIYRLNRNLGRVMELAADQRVSGTTSSRQRYARALVEIASRHAAGRPPETTCTVVPESSLLEERVRRLLFSQESSRRGSSRRLQLTVALSALVCAVGLLGCSSTRPTAPPEPTRVLYVEQGPRWEYRFLKNALLQGSDRVCQAFLLGASETFVQEHSAGVEPLRTLPAPPWQGYDVVILGDLDPLELALEATGLDPTSALEAFARDVREFVSAGGHLVWLAGEQHGIAAFAQTPLADLLPVTPLAEAPERDARPESVWRFMDAAGPAIHELGPPPPASFVERELAALPGTQVLAALDDRTRTPVLVRGTHGAGSTLSIHFGDTYKWRHRSIPFYQGFWNRCLRVVGSGM